MEDGRYRKWILALRCRLTNPFIQPTICLLNWLSTSENSFAFQA